MFAGLKTETSGTETVDPTMETLTNFLVKTQADLTPRCVARNRKITTDAEIKALISAIENFGLSRALLAFADHDGTLHRAVAEIPAVESLAADLSVDDSKVVITALKNIALTDDAVLNPAVESIEIIVLLAAVALVWNSINQYRMYKYWKQQSQKAGAAAQRIAAVVPYSKIVDYLQAVTEVPHILKTMMALSLPKTEADSKVFLEKLEHLLIPLYKIEIHFERSGHITTSELAAPIHGDIAHVGYGEGSLKNIAEFTQRVETTDSELRSLSMAAFEQQEHHAEKGEIRYVTAAANIARDVVHTVLVRVSKIAHLAKTTCGEIAQFYQKG